MRKLLFTTAIVMMTGCLEAQSLPEASKMLYYERYEGAARQLHGILLANPANAEAWLLLTQWRNRWGSAPTDSFCCRSTGKIVQWIYSVARSK